MKLGNKIVSSIVICLIILLWGASISVYAVDNSNDKQHKKNDTKQTDKANKNEITPTSHTALQLRTQVATTDIFELTISEDADTLNDLGTFTLATGPKHPISNENIFYDGTGRNPWSSYLTIRSYSSHTDYVTRGNNASPDLIPTGGFTPVYIAPYGTVTPVGSIGFSTRWNISNTVAGDDLLITQETIIEGNQTIDDSRLRVTTKVKNMGGQPVEIGIRYMWRYQIGYYNDNWFGKHIPDSAYTSTFGEWLNPDYQYYEMVDNPWETTFRVFSSVNGPLYPLPVTPPDKLQFGSWSNLFSHAFEVVVDDTASGDGAVACYWGDNVNNAITILPDQEYVVTEYIYTRDFNYADLTMNTLGPDTILAGDTMLLELLVTSASGGDNICVDALTTPPNFVSFSTKCGFSPLYDTAIIAPKDIDVGTYTLFFQGTDDPYSDNEQTEIVVINPPGVPPEFVSPSPCGVTITDTAGQRLSFTVTAVDTGLNRDIVTISATSVPPGANLIPNPDFTGNPAGMTVDWTPTNFQTGQYLIVFTATDSRDGFADTCNVRINIEPRQGIPPVFTNGPCGDTLLSLVGQSIIFTVAAADNGPNNDSVRLSISSIPAGAELTPSLPLVGNPVSTAFSWTPTSQQTGPFILQFEARDFIDQEVDTCEVVISVSAGNPPVFTTSFDDTTIIEGDTFRLEIKAVDPDSGFLSFTGMQMPVGSSIYDSGNGTAVFTFVPDYLNVDSSYLVKIAVTDGLETTADSLTISVINRQLELLEPDFPPMISDFIITEPIPVFFNEAVKISSLPDYLTLTSSHGTTISIDSYRFDSTGFSIQPMLGGQFAPLDTITVQVDSALEDLAGYPLGKISTLELHTGPIVYPGEADRNGVVDERDILPLGIFWGDTGPIRFSIGGPVWMRQPANRWSQLRATYADADGNGVINADDICAISENWGKIVNDTNYYSGDGIPVSAEDFTTIAPAFKQLGGDVIAQMYAALIDCPQGAGKQHLLEAFSAMLEDSPEQNLPTDYMLYQNYPNPFNPTTTIKYYLPEPSTVRLSVFNIMGQEVATLVDGNVSTGYGEAVWDGLDDKGHIVSSGIYFYRLQTGETNITKRMLLLK